MSSSSPDESELSEIEEGANRRNARYGLLLFAIYLILYGGFMAWNVVDPVSMARPVFWGVNLAIVYGLGLIGSALVLALVYMWLCRRRIVRGPQ